MKIFILGMPKSGRTTVSKALCQEDRHQYIDASSWIKSDFRDPKPGEHPHQFNDEYHHWFTNRLKLNPWLCIDAVLNAIKSYGYKDINFVIDGIISPKDFNYLFDYNQDCVVFLNRTDAEAEYKDYESIGISVMRDYCYWLSSAGLLNKERWLEFNFKIPGENSEIIKSLGSKNSVFIIKSLDRVILHLKSLLLNLQGLQF